MPLGLLYFRRFRMEIELGVRTFRPRLPGGYYFVPWDDRLCDVHAEVKHSSFRDEIDAEVFPCFGDMDGCRRLMRNISCREGFLPAATWLVASGKDENREFCGTIQGVVDRRRIGSIQNVGVTPDCRGIGIGTALVYQALAGFQKAGLRRAYLEVTAKNADAVHLYERIGFYRTRTVYKTREPAFSAYA